MEIAESLDPNRDVLLFPSENAVVIDQFPWHLCPYHSSSDDYNNEYECDSQHDDIDGDRRSSSSSKIDIGDNFKPKNTKWRLVVLEASWQYGKSMATQIIAHRKAIGLPPIICVKLKG